MSERSLEASWNFLGTSVVCSGVRSRLLILAFVGANACTVRSTEHRSPTRMPEMVGNGLTTGSHSIVQDDLISRLPTSLSWFENTGACLEPLEPKSPLGRTWASLRRDFSLDDDALAILATVPSFEQGHALSLHRRANGTHFLRSSGYAADDEGTRTRERTIDATTARLVLELWTALTMRIQVVESDDRAFDGTAYYFSRGGVVGHAAEPRPASILGHTIFAAERLTALVEQPARDELSDRQYLEEELKEALRRTTDKEACVRQVIE